MFGSDQFGNSYQSLDAMWEAQLNPQSSTQKVNNPIGSKSKWYTNANQYWNKMDSDYNGVLGGYGNLHEIDISYSSWFLKRVASKLPTFTWDSVLDCGAGIGRISKQLLSKHFKTIDIVDQCQKFVNKAKQILKDVKVHNFYCSGLQGFNFEIKYDCIWVQWVLTHLSDDDCLIFLKKAKQNLKEGGIIIVKQNVSDRGFFLDKEDSSVVRSTMLLKKIFTEAGLTVLEEGTQPEWPKDLFDVRMFCLV